MDTNSGNLKKIIVLGILGIGIIICLLWIFGGQSSKNEEDITMEKETGTYDSKLQAYKEKKKQEKENAYKKYTPTLEAIQPEEKNVPKEKQLPEQDIQVNTPAKSQPVSKTKAITKTDAVQNLEKILNEETEDAYKPAPVPMPVQETHIDAKEKRRQSMQAWNKQDIKKAVSGKTYTAVIHKNQVVQNNKMATFRTKEEIDINGLKIPANTLIYGTVSITANRVNVNISSVTINKNVYPLSFFVFGTDGAPGIPVQIDNIQKEAESKINNEVVNTIKNAGVVGSVIGSIASAVKREKDISCTLIDNQTIYLKINHEN